MYYLLFLILIVYSTANNIGQKFRLDKYIIPESYQISLKFDANYNETRKFLIERCSIRVNINPELVNGDLTKIRLHYIMDKHDSFTLMDKTGKFIDVKLQKPDKITNIVEIQLVNSNLDIEKQPYTIEFVNVTGTIRDDNLGIYLGEYSTANKNKQMIATKFRSIGALLAFPCFDEPSMKANFQISLTVPRHFKSVVGNSRIIGEDNVIGYDLKTVKFERTPKISTYRVGFLISTFDQVSNPLYPNFNVYYPEGNAQYLEYAVNMTPIIITEIENMLQLNFTQLGISKLDQAALPSTFSSIEHFGLILYIDTSLYLQINQTTIGEEQWTFLSMASCITELWTSKYMPIEWWSYRWLTEGLAGYISLKLSEKIVPEMELDKGLIVTTMTKSFEMDGSFHSLPLTSKEEDIYNQSSISQKLMRLNFLKSPAIFYMMQEILGEEAFFRSLQKLMKNNSLNEYTTTNPSKFFAAFESDGLPVGRLKEWTEEPGYPVVTVKRINNSAVLSQKRFLFQSYKSKTQWNIPITFTTRTHNQDFLNVTPSHWLNQNADLVIEDVFLESDWIIVNTNQFGYYRVNYDMPLWTNILELLNSDNFGGIPIIIRARLIDDVLNMARIMRQSYRLAMDVTKYLDKETDYYPWVTAYNAFSYLLKRTGKRTELSEMLKKYVASLSLSLTRALKQQEKTASADFPISTVKAVLYAEWICDNDYPDYIADAKRKFKIYKENPKILDVDVNYQYALLCNGIKYGNSSDWNFLFEQFTKSTFPSERKRILQALGCSREAAKLERLLEMTLDPSSDIKKHDYNYVFKAVLKSKVDIAQAFLQENIEDISKNYASWNALSTMIIDLTDRFTTVAQIEEFKIFVENNQVALKEASGDLAQSTIKSAEANVKWLATFEDELSHWLRQELHRRNDTSASNEVVNLSNTILFICILATIIY